MHSHRHGRPCATAVRFIALTGTGDFFNVMAGLGPAIHVLTSRTKDVDGRHKAGHDDERSTEVVINGSWYKPGFPLARE